MDSSAPGLVRFAHGQSFRISTDVLLFSDINLSLTHHYRIHKRGLPHIAFRKDYLTRLRVFMSQAAARSRRDMMSPVPSGTLSTRHARSAELESESPRNTRRALVECGQSESWRNRSVNFDFDCPGSFGPAGCHCL